MPRAPAFAAFALLSIATAFAGPFTPGNAVVYRVGTGSGNLVPAGNAVFLDEYNAAGGLVQSIPMPAAGVGAQKALAASGTATTDGLLTRSADGTCLAVPGYGRDVGTGTGNLATTGTQVGGAAIPRIVGVVRATGVVDTSTALVDASVQSNFRGAATSDCASLWVSGTAATTGGGVRYATVGAATSADLTSGSFNNTRAVVVTGTQLYASASVTALRTVASVGTGRPTSGAQAVAALPGLPAPAAGGQPYAFAFADLSPSVAGVDTLYIADESSGIQKFSLVAGNWVANGTAGAGADSYRGIAVAVSGTQATIWAVRKGGSTATGGGELVRLVDASGYNGALAGAPDLVAAAAGNTAFRGVALAPELVVTPSAGAHGTISPETPQAVAGNGTTSFTVTPEVGYSAVVGGTCGGSLSGNKFTTDPVTQSCTVEASFTQIPTYVVTPSAGAHGSIAPDTPRTLLAGETTTFTVTPDAGYSASVTGCGGTLVGDSYAIAPVSADCSVVATFTLVTFTVTPSAGAHGAIDPPTAQEIPQGTRATFTVTPDPGYSASVGGSCGGTLTGTQYLTALINAACTVQASFVPLPHYTVTPAATANGTVTPALPTSVQQGDSLTFTVAPAAGYNAAVRGTCGGHFTGATTYAIDPVGADCTVQVVFARKLVLFVGNSYTFGRVDPVMSYNAANVTDLTHAMWLANPTGSNDDEPHPWGGIPGVFKKLIGQAGLDWDVSISARNAASLRGHYLNSNPAGWDLRGNVASQRFDVVMLQDLSDEPLPAGRGANANLAYFDAYVDKLEKWVHQGGAETYTETQLYGGTIDACRAATGASASACETVRTVAPANANARAAAEVYLYQTWARPDMIGPNGTNASGQFYTAAEGLEEMTADFHDAYFGRAVANGHIEDVAPVGDAFLRAVQSGVAMRDPYVPEAGKINLWHTDYFHPSKYGSYLSALVHFAILTGLNPLSLGSGEQAAADLGIAPDIAVALQGVAQATVTADTRAPSSTASLSATANAKGWYRQDVVITFNAADEANGSGVDGVRYTAAGAQPGSGTIAPGGTLTVSTEGVTTVSWYAADRAGNTEAARTIRIALDKTAPAIGGMPAPGCIVPGPVHQMIPIATVTAGPSTSPVLSFNVTAVSNQPGTRLGGPDTQVTGWGVSQRAVAVYSERPGTAARVYTITASTSDEAGNSAVATATCTIPRR